MMTKCMYCGKIISVDEDSIPISHGCCRLCELKVIIEEGWATKEERDEYERLKELK